MPERLTESLIELEKLDTRRAEEALDRQVLQGGALDTSLLELQLADEATVIEGLQAAYQLVVATPEQACAPADPKALRMFPEPWAKKHMLAPLALAEDGEHLEVLSPGPLDAGLLSRLGELLEISLIPVLAPEFRVWQRLARLYDIEPPERFAQLIQEHGVAIESPVQESLPTPPPASEPPRESDKATLGFSEAVNELRDAADRDDIVRTTLRYAITDLEVVAMFINHDDHLEGWMGRGPGTDLIPHLKVDLTANSAFRVVLDTQAHYLGPLPSDEAHTELLAKLGRARPRGVLIVPIRIRNRTVALLYGENGSEPIAPRLAADLMLFTTHLQMALEGLLMRKKAESLSELRPSDSQAPRRAASGVNGPWASEVPSQLPVVPTTPGLDASDDTERGRPPPLEPADDTDKYAKPEPVKASETEAQPAQPEAEIAEPEPLQDEVIITEPEPEPEPPQDEVIITEPEPEMATEAETQPEPEMATEAETQLEPEMATEAETQLEPESQPEVETQPEPQALPEPEAEVQPEAEPEPEAEPVAAQVSLLSRSDSWAQATLQPEEEDEAEEITDHDAPPAPADHPLIGGDDEWTSVKTSQLDQALDATISAAQDAAMRLPDVPGVFDRSALATSLHGQELLNELDELTSSLEEAVARSEATAPEDPTAAAGDDWDSVDIDEWPEPEASEPTHPVTQIPTELAPAPQAESELPTQEPASTASARASLTEDATLPDLSAEAWIRASSEIVRPRALPQEVMEAAARPAEPEPVPLTRITIGRQRVETPRDLQEVHPQQASDDRYEVPPTPAEGMDGTVPIFLGRPSGGTGEEVPIPLTDADRITADEPVPLTQLSSGGYRAAAPGPEDPFGHDPALYDDGAPEEPSLEQALEPQPRAASHLRAVPAPTQPVDTAQLHAARVEQEALQWLAQLEQGDAGQQLAAADALTAMGAEVLPHVGQRFPGPLTVDPFRPDAELPPFTKCGPLLSVLERLGRDAHPYVLRHLDAPSPHHRFFAIYFYGAVYVPEAIPRLIQRLHDEEPRSCMLAARTLFSYREHPDFASVQDHLHGRLMATSAIARRHACYLVGLFRDVTAIPKLIDILDRKDKGMSEVAEDALAEITKQRLGLSAKKWKLWWSKNRGRSRIAWLVDGLAARDEALRRSASEELRAVTGLDMGFDENAPKRQREEARQRWIKWWREQERVANP